MKARGGSLFRLKVRSRFGLTSASFQALVLLNSPLSISSHHIHMHSDLRTKCNARRMFVFVLVPFPICMNYINPYPSYAKPITSHRPHLPKYLNSTGLNTA